METKLGEVSSNGCDARLGGGGAGDEDPDSTSQEKAGLLTTGSCDLR